MRMITNNNRLGSKNSKYLCSVIADLNKPFPLLQFEFPIELNFNRWLMRVTLV